MMEMCTAPNRYPRLLTVLTGRVAYTDIYPTSDKMGESRLFRCTSCKFAEGGSVLQPWQDHLSLRKIKLAVSLLLHHTLLLAVEEQGADSKPSSWPDLPGYFTLAIKNNL